jgi:hypothetical protein
MLLLVNFSIVNEKEPPNPFKLFILGFLISGLLLSDFYDLPNIIYLNIKIPFVVSFVTLKESLI